MICRECPAQCHVLETRQRENEEVVRRYECNGAIKHRFSTCELPSEVVDWNRKLLTGPIAQAARGRVQRRDASRKRQIVARALKAGEKVDNIKLALKTDGRLIASVRRLFTSRYGPDPRVWPV